MSFNYVFKDRTELRLRGTVNQIRIVLAHHVTVGGNRHNPKVVNLIELSGLGHGRTGHTTQFVIEPEKVLQGDGRERLVLSFDLYYFFGFNRLMQSLVVAATLENTARVFVNDDYFAIHDHVVAIFFE